MFLCIRSLCHKSRYPISRFCPNRGQPTALLFDRLRKLQLLLTAFPSRPVPPFCDVTYQVKFPCSGNRSEFFPFVYIVLWNVRIFSKAKCMWVLAFFGSVTPPPFSWSSFRGWHLLIFYLYFSLPLLVIFPIWTRKQYAALVGPPLLA